MKKTFLLFAVAVVTLNACTKYNIQKDCEKQAKDYLSTIYTTEAYQNCYDFKFSKLYESDLPIDTFGIPATFAYYQNLYESYIELYGEDTTKTIYDKNIDYEISYAALVYLLNMLQDKFTEFEKIYTVKNYGLPCKFKCKDIYDNSQILQMQCLFIFNENYKIIDIAYLYSE